MIKWVHMNLRNPQRGPGGGVAQARLTEPLASSYCEMYSASSDVASILVVRQDSNRAQRSSPLGPPPGVRAAPIARGAVRLPDQGQPPS